VLGDSGVGTTHMESSYAHSDDNVASIRDEKDNAAATVHSASNWRHIRHSVAHSSIQTTRGSTENGRPENGRPRNRDMKMADVS